MSAMSSGACSKPEAESVLAFWLGDAADPENVKRRGKLWFASTADQDEEIRARFGALHERARRGELDHWSQSPRDLLALVVLLDQFSRNLYRSRPSAFADDAKSLALARAGIQRGFDKSLLPVERAFLYMPFQHSENVDVQRESVRLFRALLDDSPAELQAFARSTYDFALLHCELIERFGRFPHRNAILGRASTREEKEYLDQGGKRFGQG